MVVLNVTVQVKSDRVRRRLSLLSYELLSATRLLACLDFDAVLIMLFLPGGLVEAWSRARRLLGRNG